MKAVFDANVVVAGAGWRGQPHLCLVNVARRRVIPYATAATLAETRATAEELTRAGEFNRYDPWPILHWYFNVVRLVEPAPLGKQRSRDVKDDAYLACALAAKAAHLVTFDKDLLSLGKPFGIEMVTPGQLLLRLKPIL